MLRPVSLLLLSALALTLACPDAPAKALRAPLVLQGRLLAAPTQGAAAFAVERVLKGRITLRRPAVVHMRPAAARCEGAPLTPRHRYLVFAAWRQGQLVATAAPEPLSKRKAVRRVLCENCAKAPSIKGLHDTKAAVHSKLKLKCRVSGNPLPRVTWFKNGLRIRANDRIKLRSKKRYSHLIINQLSLQDEGRYKCIAKNVLGNATAFANVLTATTTESPFWELRKDPCPKNNYCLNGGVCIYFAVVKEYACECADGYGGQRCEQKVISTLGNKTQVWQEISLLH